jgi:hypothetical protein
MDITAGQGVMCLISGQNGDANLYIKIELIANLYDYDCRCSAFGESVGTCSIASSALGPIQVYVAVFAYKEFSGLTFQCNVWSPHLYTVPITDMELSMGARKDYYMDITSGQGVTCSISSQNDNSGLYIKIGTMADLGDYDCGRSMFGGFIGTCFDASSVSGPTQVYVAVFAYEEFSGLTHQCNVWSPQLHTVPITNMELSKGARRDYYMDITAGQTVVYPNCTE